MSVVILLCVVGGIGIYCTVVRPVLVRIFNWEEI